jgi:hypothetical protein
VKSSISILHVLWKVLNEVHPFLTLPSAIVGKYIKGHILLKISIIPRRFHIIFILTRQSNLDHLSLMKRGFAGFEEL